MEQATLSRHSQRIEPPLSATMFRILGNDQGIIEENAFSLRLTDVMFIDALAAVASVPVIVSTKELLRSIF
jgi:hypothetical protein